MASFFCGFVYELIVNDWLVQPGVGLQMAYGSYICRIVANLSNTIVIFGKRNMYIEF